MTYILLVTELTATALGFEPGRYCYCRIIGTVNHGHIIALLVCDIDFVGYGIDCHSDRIRTDRDRHFGIIGAVNYIHNVSALVCDIDFVGYGIDCYSDRPGAVRRECIEIDCFFGVYGPLITVTVPTGLLPQFAT